MSTTWSTLLAEIQDYVDDGSFESTGDNYSRLITWANREIESIARKLLIPEHIQSDDVSLTTALSYAALPTDYLKRASFTKVRADDIYIDIVSLEELNSYDPDHDETTSADYPVCVAIEGGNIYQYPMATWTATIESYIRIPTALTGTSSTVDLPAHTVLDDLIINRVALRAFKWLNEDQRAAIAKTDAEDNWKEYKRFIDQQYPIQEGMTSAYAE